MKRQEEAKGLYTQLTLRTGMLVGGGLEEWNTQHPKMLGNPSSVAIGNNVTDVHTKPAGKLGLCK